MNNEPSTAGRAGAGAPLRLVIFDFDGTLADTSRHIVLTVQRTERVMGLPVHSEEQCAGIIGLVLKDAFSALHPSLSDEAAEACADTYRRIFAETLAGFPPKPFDGVVQMLEQLHGRGLLLAIASSRSSRSLRALWADMHMPVEMAMTVGSDDTERHKPDGEPVEKIMEALGVPAAATLTVGDMPVDILMGHNGGTRTCGVSYGNASRELLEKAGADFVIDDALSLLGVVDRLCRTN